MSDKTDQPSASHVGLEDHNKRNKCHTTVRNPTSGMKPLLANWLQHTTHSVQLVGSSTAPNSDNIECGQIKLQRQE